MKYLFGDPIKIQIFFSFLIFSPQLNNRIMPDNNHRIYVRALMLNYPTYNMCQMHHSQTRINRCGQKLFCPRIYDEHHWIPLQYWGLEIDSCLIIQMDRKYIQTPDLFPQCIHIIVLKSLVTLRICSVANWNLQMILRAHSLGPNTGRLWILSKIKIHLGSFSTPSHGMLQFVQPFVKVCLMLHYHRRHRPQCVQGHKSFSQGSATKLFYCQIVQG